MSSRHSARLFRRRAVNVPGHPLIVGGVSDGCAVVHDKELGTQIGDVTNPVRDWMDGQIHPFEIDPAHEGVTAMVFKSIKGRLSIAGPLAVLSPITSS